ncbi:unnamed protein product, partial [Closterium sp. NIES-53]
DQFLALDPTEITLDSLEKSLPEAENSTDTVAASCGTPSSTFFEGCTPSPQLLLQLLSTSLVLRRLALRLLPVEGATTARAKGARGVGVAPVVEVAGLKAVGEALGVAAVEADGVVEEAGVVETAGVVEEVGVELARVEAVADQLVALVALYSSSRASRTTPPFSSFVSGLSSVFPLRAPIPACISGALGS